MENQINVGDQNTQQIGQNPIDQQPAPLVTDKPKVNYWMISIIALLIILIGLSTLYLIGASKQSSSIYQNPPEQEPGQETSETTTPTTSVKSDLNHRSRKIRFGMVFNESSADFILNNVQPGDIYAISMKIDQIKEKVLRLPIENRMLIVASTEGAEQKINELRINGIEISYLGYDLEGWSKTSENEKQNPIEAVRGAYQLAHSKGLKLVIGPSRYFNEKYGKELAEYTDVYMPQAKAYEARYGIAEYAKVVGALLTDLKTSNPNVELWLDISPEPKQTSKTPEEMYGYFKSVDKYIDGVWVTQNQASIEVVSKFEDLLDK
ncbi:MAG: hypothetical protein Q7S03_00915 [bacterium]|nr:hypothetical protein [bacterium]